ncbi:MAG: hypothetical protein WBE26_20550 [Phycisphaerae bacterium]
MAATVVKCRACNARVARTDNECPSCGAPKPGVHAGEAMLTAFLCVFGVVGVVFVLGAMNSSTDSTPSSMSVKTETLRGTDDGYDWCSASYGARMALCRDLSANLRKFGDRDASWYYTLLQSTFQGAGSSTKRATIGEMVALGVTADDSWYGD